MSSTAVKDAHLEIGHVLFIDIVGYSELLTNEQREKVQELNRIVRETGQFRAAEAEGKLVRIPTGDGMILAFLTSPDAPVRCAVAISLALRGRTDLPLRMGIHSGPIEQVEDVNDKLNLAGAGVNMAQRVMDCADAGHILLSARAADDLAQYAEWKSQLHDLGEIEVKHGVRVRVASLYGPDAGNATIPRKLQQQRIVRRRRLMTWLTSLAVLILSSGIVALMWQRQGRLLRQAAAEAAAQRVKSVAVLPFENLTAGEENTMLAGGIHREVLLNLAKLADLRVISRTSVMRYKPGAERDLRKVAEDLGVNFIVEGSVQRAANHILITAELIQAVTGTQVWAQKFDGEIAEILSFQNEIAERISNQLGAKLSPRERTELSAKPTRDMAAFENYVRARTLMETPDIPGSHERFVEDHKDAVQLLEQALARDPEFAAGYCALVEANIQLFRSDSEDREYRARAESALKEAQRLAPQAGETLLANARLIYYGYHDLGKALEFLEKAAKLLPNNAEVTLTRGFLYRRFGRWQEAYAQFSRTAELNPQEVVGYVNAAQAASGLRWWDEMNRMIERVIKRFPTQAKAAGIGIAIGLQWRGELEAADKELDRLNPGVEMAFEPLFKRAMWKRDFQTGRSLVDEAGKYPPLERQRWEKALQLLFVTKQQPSTETAHEAEKRLDEQRRARPEIDDDPTFIATLTAVKMILGQKAEAIRLAEESVRKHPLSEDTLANGKRLVSLAYLYCCAGERDSAIQTFATLVNVPDALFYGPMKYDPVLDDLRRDARFQAIVEQSKFPFPR